MTALSVQIVNVLRAPTRENLLEKYVFQSDQHARDWMAQSFTASYRVEKWEAKRRRDWEWSLLRRAKEPGGVA